MAGRPRSQETRNAEPVHEEINWGPQALLDTKHIPARPGFVQRWIRTKLKGEDDQSNIFRKMNEGWKPRPLDTVEKGHFVPNIDFEGTQIIGVHGMILMERPKAFHDKQGAYVKEMARRQMEAIEQDMHRVHDPKSGLTRPEFETNSTRVTKGRLVEADE